MGGSMCTEAPKTETFQGDQTTNIKKPEIKKEAAPAVSEPAPVVLDEKAQRERALKRKQDLQKLTQNLTQLITTINDQGDKLSTEIGVFKKQYLQTTKAVSRLLGKLENVAFFHNDDLRKIQTGLLSVGVVTYNTWVTIPSWFSVFESLQTNDLATLQTSIEKFERAYSSQLDKYDFSDYVEAQAAIDLLAIVQKLEKQVLQIEKVFISNCVQPGALIPYSMVNQFQETNGGKFWLQNIPTFSSNFKAFTDLFLQENKISSEKFNFEQFSKLIDKNHDNSIDILEFVVFVQLNSSQFDSEGLLVNQNIDEIEFTTFKLDGQEVQSTFQMTKEKLTNYINIDQSFLRGNINQELFNAFSEHENQEFNALVFNDSTTYLGKFSQNLLDGFGVLKRANGHIIFCEWVKGLPQDSSDKLILLPNGLIIVGKTDQRLVINDPNAKLFAIETNSIPRLVFEGKIEDNMLISGSLKKYQDSKTEIFNFKLNKDSTQLNVIKEGKRNYSIGTYQGLVQIDEKIKEGSFVWVEKHQYQGKFVKDEMEIGSLILKDEQDAPIITYEGLFEKGELCKKGQIIYGTGGVYEGQIENGIKEGKGVYHFVDGNVYDGEWVKNKQQGKGDFKFKNGDHYEGNFKNGLFEGIGQYTYADQRSYEGEWRADKWHGKGVFQDSEGKIVQQGLYEDNVFFATAKIAST